jgi:hypothetical protein
MTVNQSIITDDELNSAVAAHRAMPKKERTKNDRDLAMGAPGNVTREVIRAITDRVPPQKIGETIQRMLEAKRYHKDGTELDDTRTMEAGLKLYLAYVVGMPVQRSESISVNVDASTLADMEERLSKSPAMRQAFRRVLESAEAKGEGAVEVEIEGESS